ncbi:MAG: OsmC family protein [Betaproteobacteria bacterium]|nr:OsmC family protein [Betaproteobacteria bacterium]
MSAVLNTSKVYLKPIDRDGLQAFAAKGRENPGARGTMKAHTVCDGQFRNLTYIGKHAPVVVDEPLHLFGQDTAPAPSEALLAALGACLSVGIQAVATWRNVGLTKLELFLEGDIGNPAAWGAGGADKKPAEMGFQAVRVKVVVQGDATREALEDIVRHANFFSPVANSYRNPIPMEVSLA